MIPLVAFPPCDPFNRTFSIALAPQEPILSLQYDYLCPVVGNKSNLALEIMSSFYHHFSATHLSSIVLHFLVGRYSRSRAYKMKTRVYLSGQKKDKMAVIPPWTHRATWTSDEGSDHTAFYELRAYRDALAALISFFFSPLMIQNKDCCVLFNWLLFGKRKSGWIIAHLLCYALLS